jgi:hypothetical protein
MNWCAALINVALAYRFLSAVLSLIDDHHVSHEERNWKVRNGGEDEAAVS